MFQRDEVTPSSGQKTKKRVERKCYGHIEREDGAGALSRSTRASFLFPPPMFSLSSAPQCLSLLHFASYSALISSYLLLVQLEPFFHAHSTFV
jgi:hypothetical protein